MRVIKYLKHQGLMLVLGCCITGCGKDFLGQKPSSDIINPTKLEEFQMLLENMAVNNKTSALPMLSSDEYEFVDYNAWNAARNNTERNCYIWNKEIFDGEVDGGDWNTPYECIFYSNNVLFGLEKSGKVQRNISQFNFIKGWALFNRAFAYHDLIKNFSPAYDSEVSDELLGVPIRLNPSIDEILQRASQQEVYDQIIKDLNGAIPLLNNTLPANRNQPSKISCYALLARIYLSMRNYSHAEIYADSALSLYSTLIDYNTLSLTNAFPFTINHAELIYNANSVTKYPSISTAPSNRSVRVSSDLLALYENNDLRYPIFYSVQSNGDVLRKRGYFGTGNYIFTGLATDELYLIKAESTLRLGEIYTSLNYLNNLLVNRYKSGTFTPISTTQPTELLNLILVERRKELSWRGIRWDDLKRLNKEGANIVLTRNLGGQIYTLPPNDPRYVFPIPDNEINISKIKQNPR